MANKNEKWVNITEASTLLNISISTIRRKIKKKDIKFKKQGGVYLIDVSGTDQETTTEQPKERKTTNQEQNLVDVLIKQLDEKDNLIKELNDRIKEAHILASGRLLGNGSPEKDEDEGEVIFATGKIQSESGEVVSEPTKEKVGSNITRNIIYVLISLTTLGLLGLMAIQSGFIRL